jgi:hypothetical protein
VRGARSNPRSYRDPRSARHIAAQNGVCIIFAGGIEWIVTSASDAHRRAVARRSFRYPRLSQSICILLRVFWMSVRAKYILEKATSSERRVNLEQFRRQVLRFLAAPSIRGLGLRRGRARGSHGAQAEGLIVVVPPVERSRRSGTNSKSWPPRGFPGWRMLPQA